MKQTAIQQAIVIVRSRMESIDETLMGKHTAHHLQQVERDLYDLLEAEKEMIMAAVNYGCSDWGSAKDAEDYYNEFSQAFRLFREKYKLHYSIDYECSQHDHKWGYNYTIYNYNQVVKTNEEYIQSNPIAPAGEWVYETHEEAELACLKKLIEIVKNEQQ